MIVLYLFASFYFDLLFTSFSLKDWKYGCLPRIFAKDCHIYFFFFFTGQGKCYSLYPTAGLHMK